MITLEDGIIEGGYGQKIASFYGPDAGIQVFNYGFKKEFLDLYEVSDVLKENRLTPEQIAEDVL